MNFKIFLLGILPFLFLSCHNHDFEETGPDDNTVLVYMVGDNNMNDLVGDNYLKYNNNDSIPSDILEMKEGYATIDSPDKNNLLVYVDDYETPVLIRIKMDNGKVVKDTIKRYSEMDSCDADTIKNVINYVESNFEAYHYGLILWSHGSGSKPASLAHVKSFGWDQDNDYSNDGVANATTMDIPDLKTSILSAGIYFDYILFDACEMQTIEVAYELRNCTDYIIASPWDISTDGGPYDKIIPRCFSNTLSIFEKSSNIANDFYEYYLDKGSSDVGIMISVIKTEELENLADKTNTIITKYLDEGESINSDDVFSYDNYTENYFYDFKSLIIKLIKNKDDDYDNNEDYIVWSSAYNEAVPVYYKTDEYKIVLSDFYNYTRLSDGSYGLSTYIFNNENSTDTSYDEDWYIYEWYTAAGWKDKGY